MLRQKNEGSKTRFFLFSLFCSSTHLNYGKHHQDDNNNDDSDEG